MFAFTGAHVGKNPAGTYSAAGRVPIRALYCMKDGAPLTDELVDGVAHCGPGLYRARGVISRTYATAEECVAAVEAEGGTVAQVSA